MMKLFDENPYIGGERIILRRITRDDLDMLSELVNDGIVYRYLPTEVLHQNLSLSCFPILRKRLI